MFGLSPLARGTLILVPSGRIQGRFIPAGAGNTASLPVVPTIFSVYPRWRGEHAFGIGHRRRGYGLSPLARGTPALRLAEAGRLRFIPAGAGNTGSHLHQCRRVPVYPRWRGEHRTRCRHSQI